MMGVHLRCIIGLLALVLGGCAFFGEKEGAKSNYYILEAQRILEQPSPKARERVLEIAPFRISPRYQKQALVYREADSQYQIAQSQAFILPPKILITEQVSRYLRRSGLFGAVVEGESRLQVTYLLEGAVTALYGDFRDSVLPRAVMEIQFFLIDPQVDPPEILFKTGFRTEAKIPEATPQALVAGWNADLEGILQNFEYDLRQFFKEPLPK